ncbi:alpha/beta hydrolase [Actinoplanes sp. NPDC023801]|uniref:alpha/beta hydrolase n=1 Tax=Actinoplanes sp. NPDC023801 TaxID=3154595 RepID=UPI0033E61BD8
MPHASVTSRNAWLTAGLAGFAVTTGTLVGLILPSPPDAPAFLPGGLAAPLALFGPPVPAPRATAATVPAWLTDRLSPPDPGTARPAEVAAFFARIAPAEATALTRRFPEIVGNLDGAPTALRYTANAMRFPQAAGRQILAYDESAGGRLVEVLGDLDTADRTVILIPGVDTDVTNFDTGLGKVERRAPRWQAHRLHDRITTAHPDTRIAVVAWLGYDPPEGMGTATVREDRAAAGAAALVRFVDGLLLGHPDRSVVLVGHSYGSTVTGLAAPHLGAQVTDLIAIGSPGMGVTDRPDLRTSARVWACAAPGDWIRRVPGVRLLGLGHGTLPSDPEFGALPLPCDDVTGHDGYYDPGASALPAIGAIAAGGIPRTDPGAGSAAAGLLGPAGERGVAGEHVATGDTPESLAARTEGDVE